MNVEDIMTRNVQTCRADDSLQHAAQLMWQHDCGCLPVCAPSDGSERLVGVITDRDICMRAMFSGAPLQTSCVKEAMATQVLTCQLDDRLDHVEKLMRGGRVRRLPVVDRQGALAGMISLADLAREAVRESVQARKDLTETDVGDTLAAICIRSLHA